MSKWRPRERKWRPQYSQVWRMESMDTPPLGTFVVMLPVVLEPSGAGGLNIALAEEEEEEEEQGGEDCAGEWDEGSARLC